MKRGLVKNIGLIAVSVLMMGGSTICLDAAEASTNKTSVSKVDVLEIMKLIDVAGKQRMLAQRISKDYLYAGEKVSVSKANKQLKASLQEMQEIHKHLVDSINDPDIQNLLAFVQLSIEDFKSISNKSYSLDNAQLIIDLGESMLEGSQYVVDSLKEKVKAKESAIVDKAGKQRMLSQRIAKYYIAYQAGIRDKNTVDQMKEAVKSFAEAHQALMENIENTPEINRKLHDIDRLWKIVHKFYLNIEKGGLPLIVFNTTDDITKKMNMITEMYVELSK